MSLFAVSQSADVLLPVCVCLCCRQVCEILQVHSPHSSANGVSNANGHTKPTDGDTIVISDSDDESSAFLSPAAQNGSVGQRSPGICVKGRKFWNLQCNSSACLCVSRKTKKPLSPSVFKYTVRMMKDEHSEPFTVKANQIR